MILKKNINVDLHGVEKTLLIPLWVRAIDNFEKEPILGDSLSVKIVEEIEYSLNEFENVSRYIRKLTYLGIIIREVIFDEIVEDFIKRKPNGTIVNLGCGLDARAMRFDNNRTKWIDIDLPHVISLKRNIFNDSVNYKMIESDAFDPTWFESIESDSLLILSEGLFMYFTQKKVYDLISKIKNNFNDVEFGIELLGSLGEKKIHPFIKQMNLDIPYKWGVDNLNFLSEFQFDIKEESFLDRYHKKWGLISKLFILFPLLKRKAASTVYHLK